MTASTVRFLHSSDWQLGMSRWFLSDEAGARFSQARIDAIVRLGELAREHEAAFIVVAGDVFESNQLAPITVGRAMEALTSLPVPVYLLPGNHDPLDAASVFDSAAFERADGVHVIRDATPMTVDGMTGVEIVGAPWRSNRPDTDLCAAMLSALEPAIGVWRIGLAHGQIDTLAPDTSRPDIIELAAARAAIDDGRIHYLALGDRHSVTSVDDSGRIWYSGAPVATAFTETDPNHALLVTLSDDGCEVEALDVGDWQFVSHDVTLDDADDVAELDAWLDAQPAKATTAVKVGASGGLSLANAARLDKLFEDKSPLFASLKRRERLWDLTVVPDELDSDAVSLTGFAREAWDALEADARAGDEEARNALRLFYRLSGSA